MSHSSWLTPLVTPRKLKKYAREIATQIRKDKKEYKIKAIAIRGVSGATFGGVLSYMTGLPLIIVRKESETHSSHMVESLFSLNNKEFNYVIVDDLISTGKTIDTMTDRIFREVSFKAKLVKIYLYHASRKEYENKEAIYPVYSCENSSEDFNEDDD